MDGSGTDSYRSKLNMRWLASRPSGLLTVVVFTGMLAITWLMATPYGWDNDEAGHYWTARDIYEAGSLPDGDAFPEIILPTAPFNEAGLYRYHALPPTYYLTTAFLFNLNPTRIGDYTPGLLSGRLLSGLSFVTAIVFIYWLAHDLCAGRQSTAVLIAASCAMVPKMTSLGASFTADSFALVASAVVAWTTIQATSRGWSWRSTILVGAAIALVLMSRPSALPILFLPAFMFTLSIKSGIFQWLGKIPALLALALVPNSWWMIRNWLNLKGDWLGAATHLNYLNLQGLPYGTKEVALFKGTEAGFSGIHDMLINSDWLLRFNTRLWLTERYNNGNSLGLLLAIILVVVVAASVFITIRGLKDDQTGSLSPQMRFIPTALLISFCIAASLSAFNSYTNGIFVIGRFAVPSLVLLIAATTAIVSQSSNLIGRLAAPTLTCIMAVAHLAYWGGFLLPDLLRQANYG